MAAALLFGAASRADDEPIPGSPAVVGEPADGYRGIWYMNQPSGDEYVYKYSGGLATYCAKHQPFAVYCREVDRTYFCYGGATVESDRRLVHMVSYFDHATGTVPRPTFLLDKETSDAHDNPVISVDDDGRIWIFSTSHGTSRPSYIHRSVEPWDIRRFERVPAFGSSDGERAPITNFSYLQIWRARSASAEDDPVAGVAGGGRTAFACFFTRYGDPAARTIFFMSSRDGIDWGERRRIAAIEAGHYQISAAGRARCGSAFNYHPAGKGLNWRTNLYYVETPDLGTTWTTVDGGALELPLVSVENPALVHDYGAEGLLVYLKDIAYDAEDRPVILYITSRGYQAGPANGPRTWTTARWTGDRWDLRPVTTSDNNYDMGSLWIESDGAWRIIGPTRTGPQAFNPGGEMDLWRSVDRGTTWTRLRELTVGSERNHTYARRPVGAHQDFFALWADGHGRQPSPSSLYFASRDGDVFVLPRRMEGETARPLRVPTGAQVQE